MNEEEDNQTLTRLLALVWFFLFTSSSLTTTLMASLSNAHWSQLDTQGRILLAIGVYGNWAQTMMAWLNKAAHNVSRGKPIIANGGFDTQHLTKADVQSKSGG